MVLAASISTLLPRFEKKILTVFYSKSLQVAMAFVQAYERPYGGAAVYCAAQCHALACNTKKKNFVLIRSPRKTGVQVFTVKPVPVLE
ncbi:hypothetical protein TELCIR_15977 [Teladorsagia circumcincta]|uniref:Uncharacterized protein n=1 Tax=Teladorsagia circumcincta TaxID=45464 RepID=A0A2G9TZ11_TELCI|nr:hypothetical protein TELCIR_15977 [Teladorsagia circumcincta]